MEGFEGAGFEIKARDENGDCEGKYDRSIILLVAARYGMPVHAETGQIDG